MKKSIFIIALLLCVFFVSCTNKNDQNFTETSDSLDSFKATETADSLDTTKVSDTIDISNDDSFGSQTEDINKEKVVNMFITHGEYSDGTYYIRKHSTVTPCNFLYTFCYKPDIDMFNCSVLVTTYTSVATTYDYGSVTFSWNNFENALFYGFHELENSAIIEFDFCALSPQTNMTYGNYSYSVSNNSFNNLTNASDINGYAQTCFDCINQSLSYAQSLLYGYTQSVTLW